MRDVKELESYDNEQLLPGFPDDVTLNLIAPKVYWGDCYRLSAVSRGWRDTIRSGEVHTANIRLHPTETLVIISYKPAEFSKLVVLYSMRDNRCCKLAPFPYLDGKSPHTSICVPLDGKIYVVGGQFFRTGPGKVPDSDGVYMLDLCGRWQWKQCERMIEPRVQFGSGVFDGKIYVFGGLSNRRALCGSEVYDPKEDTWSPIKATTCLRYDHQVATVGAELLVHGGKVVERTHLVWRKWTEYHTLKAY